MRPTCLARVAVLVLAMCAQIADTYGTTDVNPDGSPLLLQPIRFNTEAPFTTGVGLVSVDGGIFAVWGTEDQVHGLPVSADVTPAVPSPVSLGEQWFIWEYAETYPLAVAAVGGDALIVWVADDAGSPTVRATLYSRDDWPSPPAVTVSLGDGFDPTVTNSNEAGFVVWSTNAAILGLHVDPQMWPQVPSPQTIATGTDLRDPGVAFAPGPDVFLVTWRQGGDLVTGLMVESDGTPAGLPFGILDATGLPGHLSSHSVTWDGSRFVVAMGLWDEIQSPSSVRVARVTAEGAVEPPVVVRETPGGRWLYAQSGSRDGETLVTWTENLLGTLDYEIRAARIDDHGQVLDPGGLLVHEGITYSFDVPLDWVAPVLWDGDRYLVSWSETFESCGPMIFTLRNAFVATLTPGGVPAVGSPILLSGGFEQYELGTSVANGNFWAVWPGRDYCTNEMTGARWAPSGTALELLDAEGHTLASVTPDRQSAEDFSAPAAVGGENRIFTAWRRNRWSLNSPNWWSRADYDVRDAAGQTINHGSVLFDYGGYEPPVVAIGSDQFLVALRRLDPSPSDTLLRWAAIDLNGIPLGTNQVDLGAVEALHDATSNGSNYLIGWRIGVSGNAQSYVGRIDADLTLRDPAGIPLPTGLGNRSPVRLASNGGNYLAVWGDLDLLRATRVAATGEILDPGGFVVVQAEDGRPLGPFDVDWDGHHYIVAWRGSDGPIRMVAVRRVAADGTLPDPEPTVLHVGNEEVSRCWVASGTNGLSLVAVVWRIDAEIHRSGHGFLFWNPSTVVVHDTPVARPLLGVRAWPNPFRDQVSILADAMSGMRVTVRVYDLQGRVVRTVLNDAVWLGSARWDGRDGHGRRLPAGVYVYEITPDIGSQVTGKVVKHR